MPGPPHTGPGRGQPDVTVPVPAAGSAGWPVTSLDELTGRELAACQARLLQAAGSADAAAARAAAEELALVAAELDARARVYAAHAGSPYWCTCGRQFKGLAALDEHLDQPDEQAHAETGSGPL